MVGVLYMPGINGIGSSRSPSDCAVYAYCRFGNVPASSDANERSSTVKRRGRVRVDRQVVAQVVADRVRVVAGAGGEEAVGELDPPAFQPCPGIGMPAAAERMRLGVVADEVVRLVALAVAVDVGEVDLAVDRGSCSPTATCPLRGTARRSRASRGSGRTNGSPSSARRRCRSDSRTVACRGDDPADPSHACGRVVASAPSASRPPSATPPATAPAARRKSRRGTPEVAWFLPIADQDRAWRPRYESTLRVASTSRSICATSASTESNFCSPRRCCDEPDLHRLAVEVAVEVEDVRLEQRASAAS